MRFASMWARILPLALLSGAAYAGCATLEPFQDGCGNRVIDEGEDCDSFAAFEGATCGAQGTATACRYVCEAASDCPEGWGCGADGICRQPSGIYEEQLVLTPGGFGARRGNFDGDGFDDLLLFRSAAHKVTFFGQGFAEVASAEIPSVNGDEPTLAQLTAGDARTDIMLPTPFGLSVLRGAVDQTLQPKSYSPFGLPEGSLVALGIKGGPLDFGNAEIASSPALLKGFDRKNPKHPEPGIEVFDLSEEGFLRILDTLAGPEALAGTPITRKIDDTREDSCEQVILPFEGLSTVQVRWMCGKDGTWNDPNAQGIPVGIVGGGEIAGPAFLADVDNDGFDDLILSARDCRLPPEDPFLTPVEDWDSVKGCHAIGFGNGDGTFHWNPFASPGTSSAIAFTDAELDDWPLLVDDVDGDGIVDFALTNGLYLSTLAVKQTVEEGAGGMGAGGAGAGGAGAGGAGAGGANGRGGPLDEASSNDAALAEPIEPTFGEAWTKVFVADFQGNGYKDVVAIGGETGIDFFNGAPGGALNRMPIAREQDVVDFVVGDFDGDLLKDLAFVEINAASGNPEISIAFGQPAGPPSDIVSIGELEDAAQLVSGNFIHSDGDAIDDLIVVSTFVDDQDNVKNSLAQFVGNSSRLIQSPFVISVNNDPGGSLDRTVASPLIAASGRLTNEDGIPDVAIISVDENAKAIATEPGQPPEVVITHSLGLWVVPAEGDAELRQAQPLELLPLGPDLPTGSEIPSNAVYSIAGLTIGSLDDDPTNADDIIIAVNDATAAESTWKLLVYRSEAEGAWTLVQNIDVPGGQTTEYPGHGFGRPVIDDFDGDGLNDVGIIAATAGGTTDIQIFWNEGGGMLTASPTTIPVDGFTTSFQLLLSADGSKELIVLIQDGLFSEETAPLSRVYRVPLDESRSPGEAELLLENDDFAIDLAAGDFNGDGVVDYALVGLDLVRILAGVPVNTK